MKAKILIAAVVAALGASGCNQHMISLSSADDPKAGVAAQLVPAVRTPIPDFPVPAGFSLDENQSRSFAAGGARSVFHVYRGGANKFDVASFYRKQMASNRWILVTDRFLQREVKMDFEKETERCLVVIADSNKFGSSVEIQVELFTSGRIKSTAQEKK